MSRIKNRNTTPEKILRAYLYGLGYRYRIHYSIEGKPDIVFPKYKIAIFVHGCFWHQHGCRNSNIPKSNIKFWKNKLERNVGRDKLTIAKLKKSGWKVKIIWECDIEKNFQKTFIKLTRELI